MPYLGNTGQGATLTLSSTGSVGVVRGLQLPSWTLEKIDASTLGATGFMKYISGDLTDPGEIEAEVIFDATVAMPTAGTVETVTVQFPIGTTGNTTNATLAGTGFITVTQMPSLAINELMTLNITVAYDGDTGPAFTVESA